MHLTRLALVNFRNYSHLELELGQGLTLLQGNNACGKTNLLEAVFYLATARSPHAGAERELIRWGASEEPIPFARVEAEVARANDVRTNLEIVLVQADDKTKAPVREGMSRVSKRIKVNGVPKRALDLLGQLNAVLFLPEDLDLVFGSPGERRRYLDTTLSQIDPWYGRSLAKYNQVIEQRNSLLRDFQERRFNPAELKVWDEKLVQEGSYIISRRAVTIERYNRIVSEVHPRLTGGNEHLTLVYQPSVELQPLRGGMRESDMSPARISDRFMQQLETVRQRERGAGLTLVGPHRDDVRFLIDRIVPGSGGPMDAITYASRGQGRTIALSLKLAEVELMRSETHEDPVLLLDDVMSELDAPRRAALSETVIGSPQALITATDFSDFTPGFLETARILHACDGQVEEARKQTPVKEEKPAIVQNPVPEQSLELEQGPAPEENPTSEPSPTSGYESLHGEDSSAQQNPEKPSLME